EKLRAEFFRHFRYDPSPSEINSWRNSLRAVSQVFELASLTDHGVILEYQLPLTSKRLDCMVSGRDPSGQDSAVIVELKQWDRSEPSNGENEVTAWVGGAERDLLHPSVQVGQYLRYLQDAHTAFYDGADPVAGSACAYLHNYCLAEGDPLIAPKFAEPL